MIFFGAKNLANRLPPALLVPKLSFKVHFFYADGSAPY
jgi:hypothetical protein